MDLAASALLLPLAPEPRHPEPVLPQPVLPQPVLPEPESVEQGPDEQAPDEQAPDADVPLRWRHGREVLTGTRWAEVEHGGGYPAPLGAACREHYTGRVEIDPATGNQRVLATAGYQLTWPDAGVTARSLARLDVRVSPGELDVEVELDVDESDRPMVRHRWHRLIPRRSF